MSVPLCVPHNRKETAFSVLSVFVNAFVTSTDWMGPNHNDYQVPSFSLCTRELVPFDDSPTIHTVVRTSAMCAVNKLLLRINRAGYGCRCS